MMKLFILIAVIGVVIYAEEATLCPKNCPSEHDPVCAIIDGENRRFGNICQLNAYNCRTGEDFKAKPCTSRGNKKLTLSPEELNSFLLDGV